MVNMFRLFPSVTDTELWINDGRDIRPFSIVLGMRVCEKRRPSANILRTCPFMMFHANHVSSENATFVCVCVCVSTILNQTWRHDGRHLRRPRLDGLPNVFIKFAQAGEHLIAAMREAYACTGLGLHCLKRHRPTDIENAWRNVRLQHARRRYL